MTGRGVAARAAAAPGGRTVPDDPGVVDHDVHPSDVVDRGLDDALATGHGGDGVVARDGLAPGRPDRPHRLVGG